MYCPSCENLMPETSKYCSRCGMFLNKKSEKLMHFSLDFAWIWRRSWGGFVSGFIGWIAAFIISRMVKQDIGSVMNNMFSGVMCGVFLGTVGGIIEESGYKAFCGGILGAVGGALGGLINTPLMELLRGHEKLFPLSIMITWAVGGALIGATSGVIERNRKKIFAGVLLGMIGGALGGYLGSVFYGSIFFEFEPKTWIANRFTEGASGGLLGAVLWFFIGLIEKLYIFHRREDPAIEKKICDFCNKENSLRSWYCDNCGNALQTAAPRQKIVVTPYHGIERIVNAFKFLSWLFGVAGVLITPVIFFVFFLQDIFLAFISVIFSILFTYFMMVGFRFIADIFACITKIASWVKCEGQK